LGSLEHIVSGRMVELRGRHVVGRASEADLRLDAPQVSLRHAELIWMDPGWFLRDLGSRNGTYVAGERLNPGAAVAVAEGALLSFAAPAGEWRLAATDPPRAMAVRLEGGPPVLARDGMLTLPDDLDPVAVLFADVAGRWWLERAGELREARDGEYVQAGAATWRVFLPRATAPTIAAVTPGPEAEGVSLHFTVSQDEEHVRLTAVSGATLVTLRNRSHWYTLLTLARLRIADRDQGARPIAEHGWVSQDELCRMLAVDRNLLYTHLFRVRRQLLDAGVVGADALIERRMEVGTLRIGTALLKVERE
jgi:hypothetical protein